MTSIPESSPLADKGSAVVDMTSCLLEPVAANVEPV
jgi:hypothetical protein